MLRYLEHNRNYFSLILTLRRGIPRVFSFLVSVPFRRGSSHA